MKSFEFILNLHLFDDPINTTGSAGLSDEMKVYYSDYLIDNAEPALVHDQFAQVHDIPKNKGKSIEFRKWKQLPKQLDPLTEGVTPNGQDLNVSTVSAEVKQYGGFVRMSDILSLTTIDPVLTEATVLIASQAGRTLDTVSREELNGGTNVLYAAYNGTRASGRAELTKNHVLTVDDVKRARTILKQQNAPTIDGQYYASIINPSVSYDIMKDDEWVDAHKYTNVDNIYDGELGRIGGVRFVESTEAKVWNAEDLTVGSRTLSVKTKISVASTSVDVKEEITAADATALAGRTIYLNGEENEIVSATAGAAGSASITVDTAVTAEVDDLIIPGEVTATGDAVFSTLVLGANAYGTTALTGGGLEHIVKPLGSGGTSDPLNQRATVGWKATKVTKRLVEEYMIRIESSGTFSDVAAN